MPIDFNLDSSNCKTSTIFSDKDSGSLDLNKKPVFLSMIVSLDPPISLAIIGFYID